MRNKQVVGTALLVLTWLMLTSASSAVGIECQKGVAREGTLVERLARALAFRSRERMWATAVMETGRPGMRQLLVFVGPKDVDLRPIPRRFHEHLRTFAYTIDLEREAKNLYVIREDEDGTTLRLDVLDEPGFPSMATAAAERLDFRESRLRDHAEAREAIYPSLHSFFHSRVRVPLRTQLDIRIVKHPEGYEYVEAIVVQAAVPGNGDSWVWIAQGTDR